MAPPTRPSNARENYDWLLAFTRHVGVSHPGTNAVQVLNQPPMVLGLQAARDIAQGEVFLWYGGPYVSTRGICEEQRTHCRQETDPNETVDQPPANCINKTHPTTNRASLGAGAQLFLTEFGSHCGSFQIKTQLFLDTISLRNIPCRLASKSSARAGAASSVCISAMLAKARCMLQIPR